MRILRNHLINIAKSSLFAHPAGNGLVAGEARIAIQIVSRDKAVHIRLAIAVIHVHAASKQTGVYIHGHGD